MTRHRSKNRSWLSRVAPMALFVGLVGAGGLAFAATFPGTIKVEGKTVKKVGSGLREFLFIDIYEMGAYSESGTCSVKALTSKDEVRHLKLSLKRDIPKHRMISNMRGSLEKNLPPDASAALKGKVETFISYIKSDLVEGAIIEITYVPGKGTSLELGGKLLGPVVPGKDFADTLWRSYFGPKTCCSSLKEQILEPCGGA